MSSLCWPLVLLIMGTALFSFAMSECSLPTKNDIPICQSENQNDTMNITCLAAGKFNGTYRSATVVMRTVNNAYYQFILNCNNSMQWEPTVQCRNVSSNTWNEPKREDCVTCNVADGSCQG